MQRHRHNVKVSKLLVGLRPYQAYTKRHPCFTRLALRDPLSHPSRPVPPPPPHPLTVVCYVMSRECPQGSNRELIHPFLDP